MRVFDRLLDLLFPPRESEKLLRAASVDDLAQSVAPAVIPLPAGSAVALLPYRGLAQAAVVEAKYHGNLKAQALLAGVLAEYLLGLVSDEGGLAGPLALVPIPLSPERYKERGYNQVERICEAALPLLLGSLAMKPDALSRVRNTDPQTKLGGEERRRNIHDAFAALPGLDTAYTYIVVDDVITTGATMAAAVDAFNAAGARMIPIALTH